jgi:hypothetical protein
MKRAKIALALLFVALVGRNVWRVAQFREREPVYQGKRLSGWLTAYRGWHLNLTSSSTALDFFGPVYQVLPVRLPLQPSAAEQESQWHQADEALQQVGAEAIPTLLRMLRAKDSTLKLRAINLLQRCNVIKTEYVTASEWNGIAAIAFSQLELGTNAQAAAASLIEIAKDDISAESRIMAIQSLGFIGPPAKEAVPSLLRWTTNTDAGVRDSARFSLLHIDSEAAAKADIK